MLSRIFKDRNSCGANDLVSYISEVYQIDKYTLLRNDYEFFLSLKKQFYVNNSQINVPNFIEVQWILTQA